MSVMLVPRRPVPFAELLSALDDALQVLQLGKDPFPFALVYWNSDSTRVARRLLTAIGACDERWLQAIAVGSRAYVDKAKTELGDRAAHRHATFPTWMEPAHRCAKHPFGVGLRVQKRSFEAE